MFDFQNVPENVPENTPEEAPEQKPNLLVESYWANLNGDALGKEIISKQDKYMDYLLQSGLADAWHDMYYKFFIAENRSGHLVMGGSQGQYIMACYNKFRTLLNASFALVTNQRLSYAPKSINDSYISQAQTEFTKNIIDYYDYTKRLEKVKLSAFKWCNLLGEGGVFHDWNTAAGPIGLGQNGEESPLGDLEVTPVNPLDIIRDPSANSFGELDWVILRLYKNKYQVAARFGSGDDTLTHNIIAQSIDYRLLQYRFGHSGYQETQWDTIPIYVLLHKKTAACPEGCIAFCLSDGTILQETPLDYPSWPFVLYTYEAIDGTPFHTSPSFELSILQETLDIYISSAVTNASLWGVPNIATQGGTNASVQDLEGGGKVFVSTGGKVEVLNFLQTSPEIFGQIDRIESQMEKLVAISPVLLGQTSGNSGTQDAFSAAQSLQFNGPLSRSWTFGNEDSGTILINMIKQNASTDLLKEIAGAGQSWKANTFKDDPLKDISRVVVELVNPATKTLGGSIEFVKTLTRLGLIKTSEAFTSIFNEVTSTGRISTMTDEQTANLNIKNTVSRLLRGEYVPAFRHDNHPVYMKKIMSVLNPDIRLSQPEIVELANRMYLEHLEMWLSLTPAEAAACGIALPPQPADMPPMAPSPTDMPPALPDKLSIMRGVDQTPAAPIAPSGASPESVAAIDSLNANIPGLQ